jgi:hypothetical protein
LLHLLVSLHGDLQRSCLLPKISPEDFDDLFGV